MEKEEIELPPGFRFHPTDEELITHYLSPKVINCNFNAIAIGEADLNKSEPWDLPGRAKMGEKEWYFYCVKDRKYPTGMRTNRATESGYWKATGKDKEIYRGKKLVGMKKTLVFYKGRAPKGEKSNWVMHEYRLEAKFPVSLSDHHHHLLLSKSIKNNEWVICRIFKKSIGEKRTHISELVTSSNSSPLPPLMDYSFSPYNNEPRASHVTTFSNLMELETNYMQPQSNMIYNNFKTQTPLLNNNVVISTNLENPDSVWKHGNFPMMRKLMENQRQIPKMEFSQYSQDVSAFNSGIIMDNSCVEDEDYDPSISDGPIDLESLWNY